MIILSIFPDTVKSIAENYGLSSWDWSAILISILSLLLAIFSLFVALRTLKSQRKTELNTLPIINDEVQLLLVNNILNKAYESFIHLLVLQISLEGIKTNGVNYSVKPTGQFWKIIKIDEKELHEHLFYNNISQFTIFHNLVDFINVYNSDIDMLKDVLEDTKSNSTLKKSVLKKTIENLFPIIRLWYDCAIICFHLNNSHISEIISKYVIECNSLSLDRLYKIRNIVEPCSDINKFYMQDQPWKTYVLPHLNIFLDLMGRFTAHNKLDLNLVDFSNRTMKWIDSMLINTIYNAKGPLISFIYCGNIGTGNVALEFNQAQMTDTSICGTYWSNSGSNSFVSVDTPDNPSTWLYQIVDA